MPPSTPPRRHHLGLTYEAIVMHLGFSYQQVQRACQAEQVTPMKRSGRPPQLSQEQVEK
ncbi:hypothetical protein M501DRAFT_1002806 [Patellaria atrata CBS 101060]|uniref:Uncharacterized protein n=1 Tax=Patellaria atrata CBS 101060 TaxID=1346257 RepID=A0A9P4VUB7_9PEZI|nr:hypothetical protein M501DRAFT_1002806 [Patellaria atrata CBS 101060]